ncbi:MAG: PAS domain-containing protein, partial [Candidatus Lokiarchaeota archaeon]|nr:PAS domain-containing protein [Candidatus Lokiarchaeota archaeon]
MHIVEDMHWQFLDKISVSVIVLNLSKQIVYINKSMMEFIKYKQRDKLLNKPFNILNSIPLKIYSFITEIMEDGKTFNFVSEKLRVSHFNKIQEISISARKITQNKEIYIEFYLENIKTPQTNYKTNLGILRKDGFFFESFPNSIVLTDKDGYIIDCNQTTEKIFGLNQRDIIGKNYAELDLFTSEQISEFNKQIKKIVNGSNSKLIEMEVNRKDGKKIWI